MISGYSRREPVRRHRRAHILYLRNALTLWHLPSPKREIRAQHEKIPRHADRVPAEADLAASDFMPLDWDLAHGKRGVAEGREEEKLDVKGPVREVEGGEEQASCGSGEELTVSDGLFDRG